MKIIILSVLAVAMIGLMVPSVFAEVSGLREGQWIKYSVEFDFYASNSQLEQKLKEPMVNALTSSGIDYDLEDLEWIKVSIIEVNDKEITYAKSEYIEGDGIRNSENTIYIDESTINGLAIPTSTKIHDKFSLDPETELYVKSISSSSEDLLFQTRDFPNFEFYSLEAENVKDIDGARVEKYIYQKYEKSTGILLETEVGMSVMLDNGEWADVYLTYIVDSLSEEHLKAEPKINPNSLTISNVQLKLSDISKKNEHTRFFLGQVWRDSNDSRLSEGMNVYNYEVFWSENNTYLGKILVGVDDKVTNIEAMTVFDPSNAKMLDAANDFILEIQLRFVPEMTTVSPSLLWLSNPDEASSTSKEIGTKLIQVHSVPNFIDTGTNMFLVTIDYTDNPTRLSTFDSEVSITQQSTSTSPNVSVTDTEYGELEPDKSIIMGIFILIFFGIIAFIIFIVIWKIRYRRKKKMYQ